MPAPLAPGKRAAILEDLQAGMSCGEAARTHHVSRSTVSKLAKDNGHDFERSQTIKGTHARVADNKAKRAQLQSDLLDDAQKLRHRAWSRYPIVTSSAEGAETTWLDLPPLPDVRAAYTSIGIIVDKDAAIERNSADTGADLAKSMLGQLFESLAGAVGVSTETPPDES